MKLTNEQQWFQKTATVPYVPGPPELDKIDGLLLGTGVISELQGLSGVI